MTTYPAMALLGTLAARWCLGGVRAGGAARLAGRAATRHVGVELTAARGTMETVVVERRSPGRLHCPLFAALAVAIAAAACSFDGPSGAPGSAGDDGGTGIGGSVCGGAVEADDLISHWRFERTARDQDDSGIAEAVAAGQVTTVSGPTNCGDAVRFEPPAGAPSHLRIDDRDEWDAISSLDLFVRYPEGLDSAGILSRDGRDDNNGNVTLYLGRDNENTTDMIILRVQRPGSPNVFRCGARPRPDTWVHVGVNFGGDDASDEVELWIDGVEATLTLSQNISGSAPCGSGDAPLTIDGSADPWVAGASIEGSSTGSADDLSRPFAAGAIDNLRFASQRRDFARAP